MHIMLVDDHPLFLEGMKGFLEAHDFHVAGTARNGHEAISLMETLQPELILMDLQMEQGHGIEATKKIKEKFPETTIVILTALEDDESLFHSLRAGASGYLIKGMETEQFLAELTRVANGEPPLAPKMANRMLQEFTNQKTADADNSSDEPALTDRQINILQLMVEGYSYKEIAGLLDVKEPTIKYHVRELLRKLHLSSRIQLVVYASKKGMA